MGRAALRFTTLFEGLAIDVLAACDVAAAARLLGVSWDEKAAGRGQDDITVVSDLDQFTPKQLAQIRVVAMDMREPFVASTLAHLTEAGDRQEYAALRAGDLKTAWAWAIEESLRRFWATHSRLERIIDAAKTLKPHDAGLLSYFANRITNAGAEALNSRIQTIRVSVRDYRIREHLKTAIYFHLGGLRPYPATP